MAKDAFVNKTSKFHYFAITKTKIPPSQVVKLHYCPLTHFVNVKYPNHVGDFRNIKEVNSTSLPPKTNVNPQSGSKLH